MVGPELPWGGAGSLGVPLDNLYDPSLCTSLGSVVGPELPWGGAGSLGVPLDGANTFFGGFRQAWTQGDGAYPVCRIRIKKRWFCPFRIQKLKSYKQTSILPKLYYLKKNH